MIVHYPSKWCILCKIMIFKGYKKLTLLAWSIFWYYYFLWNSKSMVWSKLTHLITINLLWVCQFTLTFVQSKGCIEFNNDFSKILFYKIIKQRHKSIFYHKVNFFKNHQWSSYKLLKSYQYFRRTLYSVQGNGNSD